MPFDQEILFEKPILNKCQRGLCVEEEVMYYDVEKQLSVGWLKFYTE